MEPFQIVAIVVSLALTVVAVVLVTQAVRAILAVVRTGQPSGTRSENPVGRSVTMVKETFLHTRMLQWSVVGVMHWFVYFAFIVLGAAVFTAYFQLFDPEFQLPIVGHFFLYEWLGEALGVLGTIGIVYLAIYRQKHHPRSEGRNSRFYRSTMWQAYFVEAMALLEGSAILFIRGAEYNLGKVLHASGDEADHYTRFHFPVAGLFGDALYPDSEDSLRTIIFAIAMIKIVLAMIWLIVIARNLTMGVAWHRFTAWFNIWFKREPSGRTALGAMKPLTSGGKAITLDDIDDLDEDSLLGVGSIEDFSWKNILDFTTCTECGRCQSQCPAWNTEKPLNPKLLITALRDATYAKAPYTQAVQAGGEEAGAKLLEGNDTLTREAERPLVGNVPEGEWFYNPESGAAVIDAEVLWNCTSCGACVQQCPVDIEHVDHIMDMRRYAVLVESNFPTQLNGLFKGLENKGNPWNMSTTARLDWTKGLDFEVRVVGAGADEGGIESLDEVDWLFWVGCAGAYEDRAKKTTRAVAELLDMAGVSFGVLGNGETCTGDPARRAGNEFVFQGLAQQNVETFQEYKVKKVVSTCAHCFNTLKNEYKEFGIELEVVHHTQLLNRLVREGKLTPVKGGEGAHKRSITYHDPCYIGRHNDVYTPPRELLEILPGADFVEMERNSERSFCCGAGGARMWMEENIGSRINVNRTVEAVGTGADQIAVGCPFCRIMLSDGLTAQQAKGEAREEVEVLDVAQMLLASVKGEIATKLKPGSSTTPAAEPAAKSAEPAGSGAAESAGSAGSDGAAGRDEDIEAEPAAGDDTQTEDTITATEDAGPLAKASGGTSLFDTPEAQESADTADADATVAQEAKAATPKSSGGSLFDVGSDADSSPDTGTDADADSGGDAAEAAVAAPVKAQDSDLGSSGSLFDVGGDDDADQAPAAKVAPATEATPEPEAAAETAPTSAAAVDRDSELASSGSLFDVPSTPAPAASAPAASPAVEEEPVATSTATSTETSTETPAKAPAESAGESTPNTEVDLSSAGSLFDIESAPAPARAAKPVETSATDSAAKPGPVAEPEAETGPAESTEPSEAEPAEKPAVQAQPSTAEADAAPAEAPAATPTSTTSQRRARKPGSAGSMFDLAAPATAEDPEAGATEPEGATAGPLAPARRTRKPGSAGSMFDIAAPAAASAPEVVAATPEPVVGKSESPSPSPEPEPKPKPVAVEPEPAAAESEPVAAEPEPVSDPEVAVQSDPTPEPEAAPEPEPAPAPTPAAKVGPVPVSEIPEGGSLFDIVAPEPVAAAPAPTADASTTPEPEPPSGPEAELDAEPARAPADPVDEAAPAEAEPDDEPAAATELTPAQAVSAAATAVASDAPTEEPEPPAEAEPDAQAVVEEHEAGQDSPTGDDPAADPVPEPAADAESSPEPEPEPEEKPKPTSSGAAHTPRTDVAIDEGGSLFDL